MLDMLGLGFLKALALAAGVVAGADVGRATVFHASGDPGNPSTDLACYWTNPERRELRRLDDGTDRVVAHREWPCGARVWMWNPRTGREAIARVGDRGPLSADLDLSLLVCADLGCTGDDLILYALVDESSPEDPTVRAAAPIARRGPRRRPKPMPAARVEVALADECDDPKCP